jgi:hypothetical protein
VAGYLFINSEEEACLSQPPSHGGQANRMGTNWEREPGCPSPVDQFLILVPIPSGPVSDFGNSKKKVSDL